MDAPVPRSSRVQRLLWRVGGGLLIAGALIGTQAGSPWTAWASVVSIVLVALAWVAFAVGPGPTVERRVSVVALVVLAAWPVAGMIAWPLLVPASVVNGTPPDWWFAVTVASDLVPVAAALVAAVDILRGDRVPRGYRAMPLVAAGLCVVPRVLIMVLLVPGGIPVGDVMPLVSTLASLAGLCRLAALVGLGVIALIVAQRARGAASTVPVYSSSR